MLLIGNGKVITRDSANPYLENGAVVTDGENIKEVGTLDAMKQKYPEAEFVDAHGGYQRAYPYLFRTGKRSFHRGKQSDKFPGSSGRNLVGN